LAVEVAGDIVGIDAAPLPEAAFVGVLAVRRLAVAPRIERHRVAVVRLLSHGEKADPDMRGLARRRAVAAATAWECAQVR
jgi:hypothetical protein